jgi:hypothetical protein
MQGKGILSVYYSSVMDRDPVDPYLNALLDLDPVPYILNYGSGSGSFLYIKIERNLRKKHNILSFLLVH